MSSSYSTITDISALSGVLNSDLTLVENKFIKYFDGSIEFFMVVDLGAEIAENDVLFTLTDINLLGAVTSPATYLTNVFTIVNQVASAPTVASCQFQASTNTMIAEDTLVTAGRLYLYTKIFRKTQKGQPIHIWGGSV